MTQQTLPPHLAIQAQGANSVRKPYRTPGEKVFGILKYGVVGFLANVGLAYLIGRDTLIYEERGKGNTTVGKTFLPDAFHEFNARLRQKMVPSIARFISNIPYKYRILPKEGVHTDATVPVGANIQLANDFTKEELREIELNLDNIKLAEHASENIQNGITLAYGGTLVSIAMHQMEKHRLAIIKKLDGLFSPRSHEDLAQREVSYARIAEEAKHRHESVWNILGTRALALVSAVGTSALAMYVDPKRKGMERIEDSILGGLDKLSRKHGFKLWFQDGNPDTKSAHERLFSLAFLEIIVGGYTSIADYLRHRSIYKKIEAAQVEKTPADIGPAPTQPNETGTKVIDYAQAAPDFRSRTQSRATQGDYRRLAFSDSFIPVTLHGGL